MEEGLRRGHGRYSLNFNLCTFPSLSLAPLPSSATRPYTEPSPPALHRCRVPTGSFKARGAVHKLLSLSKEQLAAGVVTSSTGNHALAVLHACHVASERRGVPVRLTIYLPNTASPAKVRHYR